ncbi:FecR family protein [Echinicola vietnamensis]|uniref:Fe2+-dicitrate sensor, membrane component n=1 Tax=Echinicola vietnamensis (strain DSM 17526 / LMG 23754 / KMM 6221) TaxID=926556 RepID=L0G6A4_ECHVK|nr:FecR family protein [Echinicola vietnamensis]AGA80511.1 Fe2+-dicitrate sensor, membrane component [Echinicola vietnamensis DSM 17526]
MNKGEFERLLEQQAKGKTTPEEEEAIRQAYKKIYFSQKPLQWNDRLAEDVKGRLEHNLASKMTLGKRNRPFIRLKPLVKVAAVLALVILGGFLAGKYVTLLPKAELITKRTTASQRATITLSDGTKVHLNVGSAITFPEQFYGEHRKVTLEGEAFFEVTRDVQKPFIVETASLSTKVLGTSFNINAHESQTEMVTVVSGKVQVSQTAKPEMKAILLPDEAVVFNRSSGSLNKQRADAGQVLDWKKEYIEFDKVSFKDAIRLLGQFYHTEIILENFQNDHCQIRAICKNNGIEHLLGQLQLLVDFDYRIQKDGSIVIDYHGCKK